MHEDWGIPIGAGRPASQTYTARQFDFHRTSLSRCNLLGRPFGEQILGGSLRLFFRLIRAQGDLFEGEGGESHHHHHHYSSFDLSRLITTGTLIYRSVRMELNIRSDLPRSTKADTSD